MDKYPFRREDTGEIVELTFEDMMQQDAAGFVTLPDGGVARRVPTGGFRKRASLPEASGSKPWISENLGFGAQFLPEMQADADAHGFKGVEFVQDPDYAGFVQVRIDSPGERARYVKHRGMFDKNGRRMGVAMTQEQLDRAKQAVIDRYGEVVVAKEGRPC
jgi:hypothetical protein